MKNYFNIGSRAKIIIGFTVILASLAVILTVSFISFERIYEFQHKVEHMLQVTNKMTQIEAHENMMHSLVLEAMLYEDEDRQKLVFSKIENLEKEILGNIDQIDKDLVSIPEANELFYDIKKLLDEYRKNRIEQIALINEDKNSWAMQISRTIQTPLFDIISDKLNQLEKILEAETQKLDTEAVVILSKSKNIITILGVILFIAAILIILGIFRMISNISKDIKKGILVLGTSSAEIQTTVAEISTGTTETSTAISETTTTVEEIRQTSQVSNQKAKSMLDSAQKATEIAEQGLESSQHMIDSMAKINNQMKVISRTIQQLSEQNRSIGEITSTVADIADQSNLLAVNAAIEAAKAGEHGRGFAVVAQEIRSLSEQSKKSTAQVKEILNEIQKSVVQAVEVIKEGNVTVDEGSRLVLEDREVVEQLSETIEEAMQASLQISSSSEQQMAGMDQIVPAMNNIRQASEQNVTGINQAQQAANDLNELGQNLKKIIERYRL
ncbi:MAG: methyl-accepting chemotaxis protein [Bacteroidetes bacterium]|jgi:methyl-accepting chemotaxis protein|nr:methyl-accepting chemotaxis protein [Bacteroidota bacterium]